VDLGRRAGSECDAGPEDEVSIPDGIGKRRELRRENLAPKPFGISQHRDAATVKHVRLAGQVVDNGLPHHAMLDAVIERRRREVGRRAEHGLVTLGTQRDAERQQGMDVAACSFGCEGDAHAGSPGVRAIATPRWTASIVARFDLRPHATPEATRRVSPERTRIVRRALAVATPTFVGKGPGPG
jgi:hypothetical protein